MVIAWIMSRESLRLRGGVAAARTAGNEPNDYKADRPGVRACELFMQIKTMIAIRTAQRAMLPNPVVKGSRALTPLPQSHRNAVMLAIGTSSTLLCSETVFEQRGPEMTRIRHGR
ncbi:hypothetical protein B7486_11245 [cyanobacterium TDX16]|nr:hypothetical protein B7486_11245 [cyanobacterium TDX16]